MRSIRITTDGGDRATAYAMSNKLVPLNEGWLVTWIDDTPQNRWALVHLEQGKVVAAGPLGEPCLDNHCGATLTVAGDYVHAITGGHHSPFDHYRTPRADLGAWERVATIDAAGTYPSMVADSGGHLHLAYRVHSENRWTLEYRQFGKGVWSDPKQLLVAEKPGYIFWTNALAVGPCDTLHLVCSNTRVKEDGALLYGASHIMSDAGGETWRDDSGSAVPVAAAVSAVPLIPGTGNPARIQSLEDQEAHNDPGPRNLNYQQLNVSNPVVDADGTLHMIVHNGLTGTAELMARATDGRWVALPLSDVATGGADGTRIHVHSSLALLPDGGVRAALMTEPTGESVWGPPGTRIVLVDVAPDGTVDANLEAVPEDPGCAQWLPAQPQGATGTRPLLLYTRGENAGGFDNNKNAVKTEVILRDA